jgi:RNA polymerase sigma-70 factor (ECF subfamily)
VQAFQSLPSFSRKSSLRSWLYGIARHRCLDALESRQRATRRQAPEAEAEGIADPAAGTEGAYAGAQLAQILQDCLKGLTPQVRTAILLRFQEDFSYEDMTRICQEKAPTLQARVARALPVLRRCLEAKGATP